MKDNNYQTVKNKVKSIRTRSLAQRSALLLQAVNPGPWASTYKVEYERALKRRSSLQTLPANDSNGTSRKVQPSTTKAHNGLAVNVQVTQSLPKITTNQRIDPVNETKGENHVILSKETEEDFSPAEASNNFNARKSERRLLNVYALNQGYFAHLSGACLCAICKCGGCKCENPRKLSVPVEPLNKTSVYKESFTGKDAFEKSRPVRKSFQLIPKYKESPNPTIYQGDYQPLNPAFTSMSQHLDNQLPSRMEDASIRKLNAPFPKQSVYKENFPDWEASSKPIKINCPVISTTDNRFPFFSKPVSKDYGNFTRSDLAQNFDRNLFGKQQFKNPIGPELALSAISTNKEFSMKALMEKKDPTVVHKRLRMSKVTIDPNIPGFMNQFKTIYQEYGHGKPEICPSKIIIVKKNRDSILQAARKMSVV